MAVTPRTPSLPTNNGLTGLDPYTENSTDVLNSRGRGPLPEPMSGENLQHTAILAAEGGLSRVSYSSATYVEKSYQEPSMPVSGTVKSSVWQTRYGGTYVELSGKTQQEEFINIVHSSGTHITIDPAGSVIIKSFGDHHNVSKGNMHEMVTGGKESVYGGGYTVHVQNGVCDIRSEGNMNISSGADMTISAAGRLNINVGDAFDLGAARIALTSRVATTDIVSNGIMRLNSLADMHIKSQGSMFSHAADGNYNLKSGSGLFLQSEGSLNVNASGGDVKINGSKIYLASGADGADGAADGIRAAVDKEPPKSVFSPNRTLASAGNIGASTIDDPADI